MCEQYILQPTESSPRTENSSPQRQRMAEWSGDTPVAGTMIRSRIANRKQRQCYRSYDVFRELCGRGVKINQDRPALR